MHSPSKKYSDLFITREVLSCKAQNSVTDLPMNSPDGHELDCHISQIVAFLGKTGSERDLCLENKMEQ